MRRGGGVDVLDLRHLGERCAMSFGRKEGLEEAWKAERRELLVWQVRALPRLYGVAVPQS